MGLKDRLIELGELPYRNFQITLCGRELSIDGTPQIIGCTDGADKPAEMALRLPDGRFMCIRGENLTLESAGGVGIKICGEIISITFE